MTSVTVTEEEVEELARKVSRLDLSEGERAFLHTICELATRALETGTGPSEVAGFGLESPNPIFAQGSRPGELLIEQTKGGTKGSGKGSFLQFKFKTVFTTAVSWS
jgi:hypothetical protein